MFHYKEWLQNQVRFDKNSSDENLKTFLQLKKKRFILKFILFSATDVNLVPTLDDHHLLDFLLPQ